MVKDETSRPPELNEQEREEALRGIRFPPQPKTLLDIQQEQARPDPDLHALAQIIGRDLSIAAGVLKTVNSPFFGGNQAIESVEQAVMLLGVQNVVNIATSLSLQESMEAADYPALDRFFDTARDVALVAAALADELGVMPPDQAFTLGLFHDCGIPLLMHRFPNYKEVLEAANQAPGRPFTEVEEQHLATNHAVVGYYVSRNWGLPESLGNTILNHHRINEFLMAEQIEEPAEGRNSMASRISMLAMAEHFSYAYRGRETENDWPQVADMVMAHFELGEGEMASLKRDMLEKLERAVQA